MDCSTTPDCPVTPQPTLAVSASAPVATSDWRNALPRLSGTGVTLRELRLSDAASLLAVLSAEEVTRFISPPPSTVDGFERFILWTQRERAAGTYVCFGIVPEGSDYAAGLFQVRQLADGFATAEWGFVMGQHLWGSGVFERCARLVIQFAMETLGVHRLEARAAVQNGRGNAALRKVGATLEGVLRKSFLHGGEHLDQNLWTIAAGDWRPDGSPGRVH